MKKYDFLYTFHYNGLAQNDAIKRLRSSIQSIINQNVNVCVCNTSRRCIWKKIEDLGEIKYYHKANKDEFCKSLTINVGVRNLVKTPYFFHSDHDLIYPPTYIANIENKYGGVMNDMPLRIVTGVYNIGKDLYSSNWNEYLDELMACIRIPARRDQQRTFFGVSVGNGLIHRDSFFIIRGFDEDLKGYGGEDAIFNDRITFLCKYNEDPDQQFRCIHIQHSFKYDPEKDELNKRMWRGRRQFLQDKFRMETFNVFRHMKDIQANQGKTWGIIP